MAYDYSELVEKTKHWAQHAHALGWLNSDTAQQLNEVDTRSPDGLFASTHSARPLIVAFMGGTGVGKSALLNRLAGKAIAKSGIERPTSREVTLFHHHSIALPSLAEQLPLAKINLAQHDDERKKNIIWIDMPDFDSTELHNKQQVLSWLPHIDILIYVVSPERYRDEKAWRLLLAEGGRHAWLFVLNQWDRGQLPQFADFNQQLQKAGFVEPMIFKTICTDEQQEDDFAQLESLIISLANQHTIEQLQQRGSQVRKQALKQQLQSVLLTLGTLQQIQSLKIHWQQQWQQTSILLQQGFIWSCQQLAQHYADQASHLIAAPPLAKYSKHPQLWDEWAQTRFNDAIDEFISVADQTGLPTSPLKKQLTTVRNKAEKIVQTQSELNVRVALATPGSALHRGFLKVMRLCEITLPLAAMSWVAYQVFIGYYHSNMTAVPYLGVDFAVHSTLMCALTWLIPFFILKKAQPSLKKSALNGLNKGIISAFSLIDNEVLEVIDSITQQHTEQYQQLTELIEHCDSDEPLIIDSESPLTRMLV
ncbi:MAG: GTP-binding protein HSR1-like protein [Methylococcaceae bacterium NSP1-2]|nr:50S ribosome-binding GTPase [Methylococcaceae bacterium]OYV19795.1 MAG: GTP-binding protein HSR1-like protein [Methylococcaceae bacterium NSP1-2]